jgi:lysophospholipase L1-like esterase
MIIEEKQYFNAFGDSYTVGTGSSNNTIKGYAYVLASRLGAIINNLGDGGGGIIQALKRAWTNSNYITPTKNTLPATVMIGFNDAIRGGDQPKLLTKMYGGYVAWLANYFLDTALPASDASITKTGSWIAAGTTASYPLKAVNSFGQTGRHTSVINDQLSFTINGSTLAIGYIVNDATATGVNLSNFDVVVDGQVIANVDCNDKCYASSDPWWPNTYCPFAFVATDLGAGSHSVQIVNKDNKLMIVDYVGTLMPHSVCPQVFMAAIPKINDAGYAGRPNNPSDTTMDAASQQMYMAIKQFRGYPITVVNTNEFFTEDGLAADNVHPNNLGHAQISTAFVDVMFGTALRHFYQSTYIDASGNIKGFFGYNARYLPNGTFVEVEPTKSTYGHIIQSTSVGGSVSFGMLQNQGSGSTRYAYQVDQSGKDCMSFGRGNGSISTGQTQVVITHNCPFIPSSVIITPTSFMPPWRVTSIGATTFTIQIQSASVSGETFGWKCL